MKASLRVLKTHFNIVVVTPVLRVTVGHSRVTMGHLRLTSIGYLKATVAHIRVTLGHLMVTLGHLRVTLGIRSPYGNIRSPLGNFRPFFSISNHKANTTELHPKVRKTCLYLQKLFIFDVKNLSQARQIIAAKFTTTCS